MGPHHPSTHGVFRMMVTLDGETVVKLKPVFGYLHRNHEKLGENTTYLASMPYTDRLDYFNSMTNNWAYAISVEKMTGIKVPERAEYIRVIMNELTRIVSHAFGGIGQVYPGSCGDAQRVVAAAADRLADHLFGTAFSVHLRGIDERQPEVEAEPDGGDLVGARGAAVADVPQALPERRDGFARGQAHWLHRRDHSFSSHG